MIHDQDIVKNLTCYVVNRFYIKSIFFADVTTKELDKIQQDLAAEEANGAEKEVICLTEMVKNRLYCWSNISERRHLQL